VAVLLATFGDRPSQAAGPLQIATASLPDGSVGASYNQLLAVTGGSCAATGNASATLDSGALPGGLSVISPAGVEKWTIAGVPIATGSFPFTLHIRWTHSGVSPFDRDCVD
jgi:hypothetical protein